MVHFKLTAAAAALLAPTAMGAAPTCATTDKYVVQMCDYGTSATCATGSGVGCTNFVSGDCHKVDTSKYLKMTAVSTAGVVTFSQFTDAACGTAHSDPSVTRVTWITAPATADCINATAATAEATDIMYGEAATDYYTYKMHCAADTTVLSSSAPLTIYPAASALDCSGTAETSPIQDKVVATTATAGFCTRTAAATSTKTTCSTAGALGVSYFGSKDCTGTAIASETAGGGIYSFSAVATCNDGSASYTSATSNAPANVKPVKSGTTALGGLCTTLTNVVAPATDDTTSPAGIASAALAAVVGLGYLFF